MTNWMSCISSSKNSTLQYLPLQIVPFPVNPCLQVQMKELSVLTQSAFSSQGFDVRHSSISIKKQKLSILTSMLVDLICFLEDKQQKSNKQINGQTDKQTNK